MAQSPLLAWSFAPAKGSKEDLVKQSAQSLVQSITSHKAAPLCLASGWDALAFITELICSLAQIWTFCATGQARHQCHIYRHRLQSLLHLHHRRLRQHGYQCRHQQFSRWHSQHQCRRQWRSQRRCRHSQLQRRVAAGLNVGNQLHQKQTRSWARRTM